MRTWKLGLSVELIEQTYRECGGIRMSIALLDLFKRTSQTTFKAGVETTGSLSNMLPAIIPLLVPVLVQVAEKLFDSGDKKRDWVTGLIDEMLPVIEKHFPDWVKPEEPIFEALVRGLLEKAVDTLEK